MVFIESVGEGVRVAVGEGAEWVSGVLVEGVRGSVVLLGREGRCVVAGGQVAARSRGADIVGVEAVVVGRWCVLNAARLY